MKNSRTRIKICGITSEKDALIAAASGADAIGLVFYPKSPRAVTIEQAKKIIKVLPSFVTTVGLFVNATDSEVQQVLQAVSLDLLQFHGDEQDDFCISFSKPYIKALRIKPDTDIADVTGQFPNAQGLLLDAWHETLAGGSGESFDWSVLEGYNKANEIILAGGLKPQNVARAIRQVQPYAVDVSSGLESAPGIKSAEKITQFVSEVMGVYSEQ